MVIRLAKLLVLMLQNIVTQDILSGKAGYEVSLELLETITYTLDGKTETELEIRKRLEAMCDWVKAELKEMHQISDAAYFSSGEEKRISLYDLVGCIAGKILNMRDGEIVYRYEQREAWNEIMQYIGSDLLTCSAYAYRDIMDVHPRKEFYWSSVLNHDNAALNNILDKGLSDNHFHLQGSAPYFTISWISWMNSVAIGNGSVQKKLERMDKNRRSPQTLYRGSDSCEESFSILRLKAAAIRLYLYAQLTQQSIELGDYYADAEWLLTHILKSEDTACWLQKRRRNLRVDASDAQVPLKNWLDSRNLLQELEKECPKLYQLAVELYPNFPAGVFFEDEKINSTESIQRIAAYINKHCKEILLKECVSLFQGREWQKFCQEWDRQTCKELWLMLDDSNRLLDNRMSIQYAIDYLHRKSTGRYKDYLQNELGTAAAKNRARGILAGERWLLYHMMYKRYDCHRSEKREKMYRLFFTYLHIKELFRREMVQNNDKIGFYNFQVYQSRKNWFAESFTDGMIAGITVKEAFQRQKLKSLELRIVPQHTCGDNIRMINWYDQNINKKKSKYYYVFHFLKRPEPTDIQDGIYRYRHEKYRLLLERISREILRMRSVNPDVGKRVKGVDACSSEDGCRPEVFAHAFRVLKKYTHFREDKRRVIPQLRISYHVGEENQDVLDGLRAIDEAIYFLDLGSSDRLGHAVMLGVDVKKWYLHRNGMIKIRQQEYLDNVAWLYHRIVHYHLPNTDNLLEYLESEFQDYFAKIYTSNMDEEYNKGILEMYNTQHGRDVKRCILDFNIHNYYYS